MIWTAGRVLGFGMLVAALAGCASQGGGQVSKASHHPYAPPHYLGGGDAPGSDPEGELPNAPPGGGGETLDQFLSDMNGTAPKPHHQSLDGLGNMRLFPGGKQAAQYFFNRLFNIAHNDADLGGHEQIFGRATDAANSTICSVRYDRVNVDPSKLTYPRLISIHYQEDRATGLAWIQYIVQRGKGDIGKDDVAENHRMVFIDRKDFADGSGYYGYPTPMPSSLPCDSVPPQASFSGKTDGKASPAPGKPVVAPQVLVQPSGHIHPTDDNGGGGGEM